MSLSFRLTILVCTELEGVSQDAELQVVKLAESQANGDRQMDSSMMGYLLSIVKCMAFGGGEFLLKSLHFFVLLSAFVLKQGYYYEPQSSPVRVKGFPLCECAEPVLCRIRRGDGRV